MKPIKINEQAFGLMSLREQLILNERSKICF